VLYVCSIPGVDLARRGIDLGRSATEQLNEYLVSLSNIKCEKFK